MSVRAPAHRKRVPAESPALSTQVSVCDDLHGMREGVTASAGTSCSLDASKQDWVGKNAQWSRARARAALQVLLRAVVSKFWPLLSAR